jgi:hypothetical protein
VFPDVTFKEFYISYQLEKVEDVIIEIKTLSGQVVVSKHFRKRKKGMNQHTLKCKKLDYGQTYLFILKLSGEEIIQKILVN